MHSFPIKNINLAVIIFHQFDCFTVEKKKAFNERFKMLIAYLCLYFDASSNWQVNLIL